MKTENYNCDYYDVENDIKNNLNDQQQIEINKGLSYEDRMRYEDRVKIAIKSIADKMSYKEKVYTRRFVESIEQEYKNKDMPCDVEYMYTLMSLILSEAENK